MPAIVTDVGGCREVIDKTQGGVVVPPKSIKKFSDHLADLINDHEKRAVFSKNARKYSVAFDITHALNSHYDFYRQVVGTSRFDTALSE